MAKSKLIQIDAPKATQAGDELIARDKDGLLVPMDDFSLFRRFNNKRERRNRQNKVMELRPNMKREEVIRVLNSNISALISSTVSQMQNSKGYFADDIDFMQFETVEDLRRNSGQSKVSIVAATSRACNLRCSYCYESSVHTSLSKTKKFTPELVERILKVFGKGKISSIAWQGGEPLLLGADFYDKADTLAKEFDEEISFGMQTNGTLVNDRFIDVALRDNIRLGISFDGLANEKTRKSTPKVVSAIAKLRRRRVHFGTLQVIDNHSVNNLIDEYEFAKMLGINQAQNIAGDSVNNDKQLVMDGDVFANAICELFDYWVLDRTNPAMSNLCLRWLETLLDVRTISADADCAGRTFQIDAEGAITPCQREWGPEMVMGNVHEINSFDELTESPVYKKYMEQTGKLLKKCSENCQWFYACHSGCYNTIYFNDRELTNPEPNYCYAQRKILKHFFEVINSIPLSEYGKYNPVFINTLFRHGFRSFQVIDEAKRRLAEPGRSQQ